MEQNGLLADPSRTADIASVLRVPGTLNNKYDPPLPVELIHIDETLIDAEAFLKQIDSALEAAPLDPSETESIINSQPYQADSGTDSDYPEPSMTEEPLYVLDMNRLSSALKSLSTECSEYDWKYNRIGALANAARQYPALADTLFKLACDWSSGKLAGKPSVKWSTPSSTTGKAGKDIIYSVWQRFMTDSYSGKRITVGTIYYHARQAGWNYDDHADIAHGETDHDC